MSRLNFILIPFYQCNCEIYLGNWTLTRCAIKEPYRNILSTELFLRATSVVFQTKEEKPSSYYCIKSVQKGSRPCLLTLFFSTRIKYSPIEKSLKRLNWSIDKLSCKTLFGLLILDLFQFYTLNNLVEMYKIEKIVGNNNNWVITNDCLVNEMLYIKQLTPSLNVQTDSIRAKVFV